MEKVLTPQNVAERYDVCIATVWRWIRSGRLTAVRLTERSYRIRTEDIEAFERGDSLKLDQLKKDRSQKDLPKKTRSSSAPAKREKSKK